MWEETTEPRYRKYRKTCYKTCYMFHLSWLTINKGSLLFSRLCFLPWLAISITIGNPCVFHSILANYVGIAKEGWFFFSKFLCKSKKEDTNAWTHSFWVKNLKQPHLFFQAHINWTDLTSSTEVFCSRKIRVKLFFQIVIEEWSAIKKPVLA